MAELIDESSSIESTTVGVYRTSSTVAGGRRFSFAALVVVGDKQSLPLALRPHIGEQPAVARVR